MIDLNIDLDRLNARKNFDEQTEDAAENSNGREKGEKPYNFVIHEGFTQNIKKMTLQKYCSFLSCDMKQVILKN